MVTKRNRSLLKENGKGAVSLSRNLMFNIVALSCAIVMVLASTCLVITYAQARSRMADSTAIAAKAYSQAITNKIGIYKAYAESMAKDARITPEATVEELNTLRDGFKSDYGLGDVFFLTKTGCLFDNDQLDLSSETYFQKAVAGETYISAPVKHKLYDTIIIYVATAVDNGTDYGGVLVVEVPVSTFNTIVEGVTIGENGDGYIIDSTGTMVANEDETLVTGFANYITLAETDNSYAERATATQKMLENQEGYIETRDASGKTQYCAYTTIDGTDGWILAVNADKAEMMSSFKTAVLIGCPIAIVAILIAILVALRITKTLTWPISRISDRLVMMRNGQLTPYQPKPLRIKEMETLGRAEKETVDMLNIYISDINRTLSSLSENDLNVEIDQEYIGDFEKIKDSMVLIINSLNETIRRMSHISEDVLNASEQVSSTAQTLAQGATEQASAVEELLATINGISDQVGHTAGNAEQANEKAVAVRSEITRSNEQMQTLIGAMGDISSTSNQVAKIVKLIEDIAFQTNILALNAAVEAARAGVNGKSFAVVADEVKNLATKSAAAAEDTTNLIKNTIEAVDRGMGISTETADLLAGVVGAMDDMAKLVAQISDASAEESISINQVVQGLDQVSTVVQSNSATAEESAAVSHELANHANNLQKMVENFKLKNN